MANTSERRTETRINCMGEPVDNAQLVAHSLIVDVTCKGAGLLVLKEHQALTGNICLKVLHPDFSTIDAFDVNAEVIWVDEDYSSDHRKVGIQFCDINDDLNKHIDGLVRWLNEKDHYFLHCEVVQL
ncbi:MAG: PilZ domain-containing protein [Gammaproteobacteria bacterium]|nr:PilZ domain-containing protein [Gammaproteobacteria bacterium]